MRIEMGQRAKYIALAVISLTFVSAFLIYATPMRILLLCKEAWECHYFSSQSPWPWLFIEEPVNAISRYGLMFLLIRFTLVKLNQGIDSELLFFRVLSLYVVEFLANVFIAVTLMYAIASVKHFVLFLPYTVILIQGIALTYFIRQLLKFSVVLATISIVVIIWITVLLHSFLYRYLVNLYAEGIGLF